MENIRRTGILNRNRMLVKSNVKENIEIPELEVGIQDTFPIFTILAGGVLLAILTLAAEFAYFKLLRHCNTSASRLFNAFHHI